MVFPHDEPLAGRNMKKVFPIEQRNCTFKETFFPQDPLHEELEKAGCVYQVLGQTPGG